MTDRFSRRWAGILRGGKILSVLLLVLPGGCLGGSVASSNPGFMIVVNRTSGTGSGTQGLLEYILPLSDNQSPLVTRTSHGSYAGGVVAQTFLFVFGDSQGAQSLWTYTLPLSKSATPKAETGFTGTPVAALAIANDQFIVFLEKTSSGACLEGFTFSSLANDVQTTLPSPAALTCTQGTLSLSGSGGLTGGSLQLSGDGSEVFIEASTSSQVEEITVSAGSISSGSLGNTLSHTLSGFDTTFSPPLQGLAESSTLLLLPNLSEPAILFYTATDLTKGSGAVSSLADNPLNFSLPVNLLALDPFGTILYTAVTSAPTSTPALQSYDLNTVQNGPGNPAPLATAGKGLDPVGLLTFTASQG